MQRIRVDGEEMAYVEMGEGAPLVFISGWGGEAAEWRSDMRALSTDFRCLTIEHPGLAGQPLPDGECSTADMAERIARGLEALGVERAAVLGLSMGGAIGQELALVRPGLVARLVLCGTFARLDPRAAKAIALCTDLLRQDYARGLAMVYWLAFGPDYYEANLEALDAQLAVGVRNPVDHAAFAYQARACLEHDTRRRLAAIACPTLVIHGAEDLLVRPRHGQTLAEAIPDAHFEQYGDGGHLCCWEQPERFRSDLRAFLGRSGGNP
jgi:pimeloyl-ACP methyl ester carboxylesterase